MLTEVCKLYWVDVKAECVRHDWYTRGTNAEYEKLQRYIWDNAGDLHNIAENRAEVLQHIAEDILAHSDTEYSLLDIMTCLAGKCLIYYVN